MELRSGFEKWLLGARHTSGAVDDSWSPTYYIHAAVADAVSTAVALVSVHFYADKTEAVEETVDHPWGR